MLAWTATGTALQAALLPHKELVPTADELGQLARVRALLTTSTAARPNPVHIVFYGQSISLQSWWTSVAAELQRLYPSARLRVENRSISGFQDWALCRTALADLVPMQPDLVIFHAYGSGEGAGLVAGILRAATSADILIQTDHVNGSSQADEETDPSRIAPTDFIPYRNYVTLPTVAKLHGACLARVRDAWKDYLKRNGLEAGALLADGNVHLNGDGLLLMSECVLAYLRPDPSETSPDPWHCARMQTAEVGAGLSWRHGVLDCRFSGSAVAVRLSGPVPASIEVWIDGRRPSSFPELHGFSRVSPTHFAGWPALSRVGSAADLLEEEWTLTPRDFSADGQEFSFSVRGSRTGPDGEGSSTRRFVSASGRVVIEPSDHWLGRAVFWSGNLPVPDGYEAHWQVERHFLDSVPDTSGPSGSKGVMVQLAQGLTAGPHRLVLVANDGIGGGISAVHIASPEGTASVEDAGVDPSAAGATLRVLRTPQDLSLAWSADLDGWRLETSTLSGPGATWGPVAAAEIHEWAGWRTLPLGPFASPSFFRLVAEVDGAALPGQ